MMWTQTHPSFRYTTNCSAFSSPVHAVHCLCALVQLIMHVQSMYMFTLWG